MIPYRTKQHHTLYVLNKYRRSFDILDSLSYKETKGGWAKFHKNAKELVSTSTNFKNLVSKI